MSRRTSISAAARPGVETVMEQIRQSGSTTPVTFLQCDLADLSSVQRAAEAFLAQDSCLDVLMCNAGIMAHPAGLTADGYEIQFGTNHLGHALLIHKLLPRLEATAAKGRDVRVITLTSFGLRGHPPGGIPFSNLRTTQEYPVLAGWICYGQSKLANLLYAR
ncbi:oxidoreductase, short-chain dehydrogenase/reductase family [Aspergillus saccharolyticus JOP 1030-1]|uniref:NAD(P)-binding protein n=1 Tax=Aspergillus saccharolyticus JOP 1030-1 TaxID=1450539 RepID=A0A319AD22_9EURO|nr:NAD(P)-binding protein [Aspergillus saccharolyticus JOP 1030-1]PYH44772.1 NAD(P)-binding protein [Aspergillus saccharolyticus JOP 1030-1]